jgi:glycosyltransferase involved in cell wall biosynthesis
LKIVNIVPGFGGTFYCGNCLRDSGFVRALRKAGYEAHTVPIYLPLSLDHCDKDDNIPVFYGAISIYLKQRLKWLHAMPAWLEHFFNSGIFLKMAARRAGSTRAAGLEDMTISMLNGPEGYQAQELDELIRFLKNELKPDIVHLSNALLLGLVSKIKKELDIPVVCTLQDEDVWIDAMRPEYIDQLWKLLSEKAMDVDAFFPVSHYFAGVMKEKMNLPGEKIKMVYVGIDANEYLPGKPDPAHPVIGYLSRLNEENGFGLVVDAFIQLKKQEKYKNLKLKATGGKTGDDNKFVRKQINKLKRNGIGQDVQILDAYEGEDKKAFLRSLSLLTVPVLQGEAFGLYQLEAMASGVPLVQPALGAFTEIIGITGGGVTYEPNDAATLSQTIGALLDDPKGLSEMAELGRSSVLTHFNMEKQVEEMAAGYRAVIGNHHEKRN